jgi:hypothetical protein
MLSSLYSQMCRTYIDVTPEVIGKIYNDGFGGTADNNPFEGVVAGKINLLMWKPRGDIKKIAGMQCSVKLSPFAPPNIGRAAKNIGDRVLLPVVMDSRVGPRFNHK